MSNTQDVSDGYHTFGELYQHRTALMLSLMSLLRPIAWYSMWHADGTMFPDHFIVGLNLPQGTITYHIHVSNLADVEKTGALKLDYAPEWDGHKPEDVVKRLKAFSGRNYRG